MMENVLPGKYCWCLCRHAGVWSAEEVTKMCRDKLLRLRSLYMSQFERLKHVYKNKRRKFLMATSANEEGLAGKFSSCAESQVVNTVDI
jgi:KAT8 regulatory NSL complex subunit 2